MGAIVGFVRTLIEGIVTPFDWLGPFWGLTLLSFLSGVGMLWVVGKTTPQSLVEKSRNKMDSAIYEIRLFLDSPKWVLRSIGRLLSHSILYIAFMLPAFVILAVPLGMMYLSLDIRHGMEPVPLNQPFVVSIDLADGIDGRAMRIDVPSSLELTAPPMYVSSDNAVHLRVVAKTKAAESLAITVDNTTVKKKVVSDTGAVMMAPDRASGLDLFMSYGAESPLDGPITGISVPHESTWNSYLGIDMPWWLWWLFVMMVAAFGLRKRLGVAL